MIEHIANQGDKIRVNIKATYHGPPQSVLWFLWIIGKEINGEWYDGKSPSDKKAYGWEFLQDVRDGQNCTWNVPVTIPDDMERITYDVLLLAKIPSETLDVYRKVRKGTFRVT